MVGVGVAAIAGEERIGAEQRGGVDAVDQLGNLPVVQRRRIEIDLHSGHQAEHQAAGEAEGVEDRQRVEGDVGRGEIVAGEDLADVGEDVGVGQHDALRHALRTRSEQHRRGVVGLARIKRATAIEDGAQLVGRSSLVAEILQPNEARFAFQLPHELFELAFLDEAARAQHDADACGAAGGDEVEGAGGEVQHPGDAARSLDRHEGDGGGVGIGQHQTDGLARRAAFGDLARQQRHANAETALGQGSRDRVLEDHMSAVALAGAVLERLEQGAAIVGGDVHRFGHHVVERRARR